MDEVKKAPELVIFGDLGYDELHAPDINMKMQGGSAYYAAAGASRFSDRVGLLSIVGSDYDMGKLALLGADTEGVQTSPGSSFLCVCKYAKDGYKRDIQIFPGVRERFSIRMIPEHYLKCKYYYIATTDPKKQGDVASYIRSTVKGAVIGIDTVKEYLVSRHAEISAAMAVADVLFFDMNEFRLIDKPLLESKAFVYKLGRYGAVYSGKGTAFHAQAPRVKKVEKSGSGDILGGAFMAQTAAGAGPESALKNAVELATMSVTAFGIEHIIKNRA